MVKTEKAWKCYSVSPKIEERREEGIFDLGGKFGELTVEKPA